MIRECDGSREGWTELRETDTQTERHRERGLSFFISCCSRHLRACFSLLSFLPSFPSSCLPASKVWSFPLFLPPALPSSLLHSLLLPPPRLRPSSTSLPSSRPIHPSIHHTELCPLPRHARICFPSPGFCFFSLFPALFHVPERFSAASRL
jgi:hypothetical protein